MYTAYVLVKNLDSESDELNFSNFRLKKITQDDDALRDKARKSLFPGSNADYGDWIYERYYHDITPKTYNRMLTDILDTFFLLRLFKVGDLVFLQAHIKGQDCKPLKQEPHRITLDISPFHIYEMKNGECSHFDEFASEMMSQRNWHSSWFQIARRFFLYGSSKEFNPIHNEIDRIVDFMVVMESVLVPEKDFVGRRLRERAVSLLINFDMDHNDTRRLIGDFYDLRSKIVHGDDVSSLKKNILDRPNEFKFEEIVREVIKEAIKSLPEDEENRKALLKRLFDVCDGDKATKVYQDFCVIKDAAEKKRCFDLISKRLLKAGPFTENGKQKTENRQ